MANLVSGQSLESLRSVFDCPFTLIDVGAAGGVNRRYWKNFRNLTIVGFEPDEREFSKLQQSEGQRWYQIALNSSDGVFDLNVTRHQTNMSYPWFCGHQVKSH